MITKACMAVGLIAALSLPAHAQRRYTQEEIVGKIAECMVENAPQDWQRLIFSVDKGKAATHQVIAGNDSAPKDLKPCRPDYVPKAVNAFRESQDGREKTWTGVTVTMEKDGRFSINFRYPK